MFDALERSADVYIYIERERPEHDATDEYMYDTSCIYTYEYAYTCIYNNICIYIYIFVSEFKVCLFLDSIFDISCVCVNIGSAFLDTNIALGRMHVCLENHFGVFPLGRRFLFQS